MSAALPLRPSRDADDDSAPLSPAAVEPPDVDSDLTEAGGAAINCNLEPLRAPHPHMFGALSDVDCLWESESKLYLRRLRTELPCISTQRARNVRANVATGGAPYGGPHGLPGRFPARRAYYSSPSSSRVGGQASAHPRARSAYGVHIGCRAYTNSAGLDPVSPLAARLALRRRRWRWPMRAEGSSRGSMWAGSGGR